MKRINKCRTLAEFNESILKQCLGQQQDTSSQTAQQQSTENNAQATQAGTDKSKENNATQQQDKADEKAGTQQNQSNATQYLFFGPDEFLITTYKMPTGWWYGYKDTGDANPTNVVQGFFPSNFVQVIEEFPEEVVQQAPEKEEEENKDDIFGGTKVNWADYAHSNYLNEAQLVLEERLKRMADPTAPENRNAEGILRYKKIKIHESRSHAVNPWKGGKVTYGQIAVKDQSAVGKAYRQMHHYFDYDKWIEEMNANPKPKAKPDPSRKKKKGMPEWLKKLGKD